jgi:hypothetical protein
MLFDGGCHWVPLASLVTLSWLLVGGKAQLISTGFSVTFNDVYYYISPYAVGNVSVEPTVLSTASAVHGFYPVTVIQEDIGVNGISSVVKNFTSSDDVFQEAFLQGKFISLLHSAQNRTLLCSP